MVYLTHWIEMTVITALIWTVIAAFLAIVIKPLRWSLLTFLVLAAGYGIAFGRAAYQWGDGVAGGLLAGTIMFATSVTGVLVILCVARWRMKRRASARRANPQASGQA
jgi:hypothetical protein